MNLLPQASGIRPRLACEISPQGVVSARAETAVAPLSALARVTLAAGSVTPSLKPGNIADRLAVVAAIRKTLEDIGVRPGSRGSDLTLVIPDASVRVLLLDFDALPTKLSEALPIVRFRLKKLLPFDADDAMISYQVMSTSKQMVRVLAVAIPRDVLAEYEGVAREAGFDPGAVLPSTLACVAALDDAENTALLVNANPVGVTTAIVRSGILLLHRSVDLQPVATAVPANVPPAMFENVHHALPLVDVEASAGEWAAQEALPEHGRNPYADRMDAERAVQDEDGITGMATPGIYATRDAGVYAEPAPVSRSPYATSSATDFNAEIHNAFLVSPNSMREFAEEAVRHPQLSVSVSNTSQWNLERDIAEAVNVAAAYFEDTLAEAPKRILCAGPMGAEALQQILAREGVAQTDGLRVRELVDAEAMLPGAVSAAVPRGWLAGVVGGLRG